MLQQLVTEIFANSEEFCQASSPLFGGGSGGEGRNVETASIAGLFSLQTAEYATGFTPDDQGSSESNCTDVVYEWMTQPAHLLCVRFAQSTSDEPFDLGSVYMRKLSPARVSYRRDFLTGSFHISLFEGTLHVVKMHV